MVQGCTIGFTSGWEDLKEGQLDPGRYERLYRGTMSSGDSPNDPVFWLHHANIDRLWADWQLEERHWKLNHKGYLPINNGPKGINVDDPMPPWYGTSKPSTVANFYTLSYKYKKYFRPNIIDREEVGTAPGSCPDSAGAGQQLVARKI